MAGLLQDRQRGELRRCRNGGGGPTRRRLAMAKARILFPRRARRSLFLPLSCLAKPSSLASSPEPFIFADLGMPEAPPKGGTGLAPGHAAVPQQSEKAVRYLRQSCGLLSAQASRDDFRACFQWGERSGIFDHIVDRGHNACLESEPDIAILQS